MRMLVVYKTEDKARQLAEELMHYLAAVEDIDADCMPADILTGRINHEADLVYVLGGDGTILRTVHSLNDPLTPILGVNFGRIGFLAGIEPHDLMPSMNRVLKGDFQVEERLMIEVLVLRNRQVLFSDVALNEMVIRSQVPKSIRVDLMKNERVLFKFEGDGLICATPTGSTGYSFSAGGPIIEPQVQALCITPICPLLSVFRSQIVGINSNMIFCYKSIYDARVSVDGEEKAALNKGDRIWVRKSNRTARFIQIQAVSSAAKMLQKANITRRKKMSPAYLSGRPTNKTNG